MIPSKLDVLALAAAAGIVLAFFAPWVVVDAELSAPVGVAGKKFDQATGTHVGSAITDMVRKGVTAVTGRTKVAHMSGWQIARSDRNEFLKFVGELTVVFGGKAKDPRQVRLLFLLPIGGCVLGFLIYALKGIGPRVAGGVSAFAGVFMFFKLLTSPLGNEIAQAHLQWGIWTTATLFVILGVVGALKK